jgi:hypothetical protein
VELTAEVRQSILDTKQTINNITNIQKDAFHCQNIQNKHWCFHLNKKASRFRNAAFVLNTVTTEIVLSNVGDITHVKPVKNVYVTMKQTML